VQPLFDFISTIGGKVIGAVVAVILVIVIISFMDRHPRKKDDGASEKRIKEPKPDDE